jgi:hypothetical protein
LTLLPGSLTKLNLAHLSSYQTLAESLLPLLNKDEVKAAVRDAADKISAAVDAVWRAKMGFSAAAGDGTVIPLWDELEPLMRQSQVDWTVFWRQLAVVAELDPAAVADTKTAMVRALPRRLSHCVSFTSSPTVSPTVPLTVSLTVSLPLCLHHRLSHCVSHRLPHRPSHCVSHCVSPTVSPSLRLPLCLSHCVTHCGSFTSSPTVSPSLVPPTVSPTVAPSLRLPLCLPHSSLPLPLSLYLSHCTSLSHHISPRPIRRR